MTRLQRNDAWVTIHTLSTLTLSPVLRAQSARTYLSSGEPRRRPWDELGKPCLRSTGKKRGLKSRKTHPQGGRWAVGTAAH